MISFSFVSAVGVNIIEVFVSSLLSVLSSLWLNCTDEGEDSR